MESSTLQCARSQCVERFAPKALAPRKRFCSTRCRTMARTERLIKQGQIDILRHIQEVIIPSSYIAATIRQLLNDLDHE